MPASAGNLLALKRRWVPLFVLGSATFGAGLVLFLLWLYRSSPLVEVVVGLLTTPARGVPPRGTLISASAAVLTVAGVILLALAVRRINGSQVGEIDSFWWKVAVASLAGRWWLGEPRVVLIASGEALLDLARALKSFTGYTTVLTPGGADTSALYLALAEDETAMASLWPSLAPLEKAAGRLSPVLRLRGHVLEAGPEPRVLDAITRAHAIVVGADAGKALGLPEVAACIRRSPARKVFVPPISAADEFGSLAGLVASIVERIGLPDVVLVNNNYVPDGVDYLQGTGTSGEVARDLLDWANPTRHDPAKLGVFLREACLR